MSPERHFPLSEAEIFTAEKMRATGNVAGAAEATRPVLSFPLENLPQLPEDEQKRLLMTARINVVAETSLANRSWEAPSAAHYLGEARKGIVNVYRSPEVQETVDALEKDTRGEPYEFRAEMWGDEAAYMMALAALTGNAAFLDAAVEKMNLVIEQAEEPTAKSLALFNRNRVTYRSQKTKENFAALKESSQEAIKTSEEKARWERVATVASRYAIDSVSNFHPVEAFGAVATTIKASLKDHSTARILPRQIVKAVTESVRHKNWQRTIPSGTDYSELLLP